MNVAGGGDGADEHRGRSPYPRSGGLNAPSDRPSAATSREAAHHNPFDDAAAEPSNLSLRGVSPRPIDTHAAAAAPGATHDSPTSGAERRSIFREDI